MDSKDPNSIINSTAPLITDPKGLDAVIQVLQIELSQRLQWLEKSYGQAWMSAKEVNGETFTYPQVWQGKGKDMLNVLENDTLKSFSFFVIRDPETIQGDYRQKGSNFYQANVDLIMVIDLEQISESDTYDHLYLENLAIDVQNTLNAARIPYNGSIEIEEVNRNPDGIFPGFTINWEENQRLQYPRMGLRFNLNLTYLNDPCGLGANVPNKFCPDGVAIVQDQDGKELARQNIPSGETGIIPVNVGSGVLYTYPYDSFNTGQDVSYATGDDKDIRDTVFAPEIASWDTSLVWSFPVLDQNDPTKLLRGSNPDGSGTNIFGNLKRFTDTVGTQVYANDLVIDHLTGIMTTRDVVTNTFNWSDNIIFHNDRTVSGYNDLFAGNQLMYSKLVNQSTNGALNYPPYNYSENSNTASGDTRNFWTSSTSPIDPNHASQFMNKVDLGTGSIIRGGYSIQTRQKIDVKRGGLSFRKAFTYNPTTKQMDLI